MTAPESESGPRRRALELMGETLELVAVLRSEEGCPWDRALRIQDMGQYVIEEAYEVASAGTGDLAGLPEELGDLLLLILMQAQIAAESGKFDVAEVISELNAKLVRRHPHVFGDARARDPAEAIEIWQSVKADERSRKPPAQSQPIPGYLPALKYAREQIARARGGPEPGDVPGGSAASAAALADRIYDLVAEADDLGIDAETALRRRVDDLIGEGVA
ncbi:MAG: hypothetical protein OXP37_04420 [Chloroflexota bacterium]|nr:hypothetical protein [Chloroflexota bacterium]MDE2936068.1 hypothetical protein [Chloroflexota bacterium]MXW28622.1 hypothetical protein [Chloroflexota bacterium]MXX66501.1 hypothetical protein [Chloroflexota bacterium]MXY12843.1 hypothetical protein [Chloroflexota bacterium]